MFDDIFFFSLGRCMYLYLAQVAYSDGGGGEHTLALFFSLSFFF